MTQAEKRMVKELEKEMEKWSKLCFASFVLCLYRDYGYRHDRLLKVLTESINAFDECASMGDAKSMIQMLDEETGIELQNGEGKSYRDLPYLCSGAVTGERYTPAKRIAMRVQQKKWIKQSILAGILLAMHRIYKFGGERTEKLYLSMENVMADYNYVIPDIVSACKEETGINIVRYYESGIRNRENRGEVNLCES